MSTAAATTERRRAPRHPTTPTVPSRRAEGTDGIRILAPPRSVAWREVVTQRRDGRAWTSCMMAVVGSDTSAEEGSIVGQWGLPGVSLSGRDAQARVLKVGCNLLSAEARDARPCSRATRISRFLICAPHRSAVPRFQVTNTRLKPRFVFSLYLDVLRYRPGGRRAAYTVCAYIEILKMILNLKVTQ